MLQHIAIFGFLTILFFLGLLFIFLTIAGFIIHQDEKHDQPIK